MRYFNYTVKLDDACWFIINAIYHARKNQLQSQQENRTLKRWDEMELSEESQGGDEGWAMGS